MSTEGQTSSPKKRRGRKIRRESSEEELTIEELFPNDMDYDADIEVRYPDQYQEPDSEPEDSSTTKSKWYDIDEDLSARMRRLGRDRSVTPSPFPTGSERGRKRQSLELDNDLSQEIKDKLSELEVMEILEGRNESRPIKRRKKRTAGEVNESQRMRVASTASSDTNGDGSPMHDNDETVDEAMDVT